MKNHIDQNYIIVLVGLDSSQIKRLLNMRDIERTENSSQLAELYSAVDVFVNPTLEDNFPTTNIEALACATPVVTYKTGGSVGSISQDAGLVVEKGDIDGLQMAINIVRTKGKAHFSGACRGRAVKFYNKTDHFGEYLDFYQEIIKNGNNK